MTPLLTVEDLHTYYGASHILFGVSLEVREGEVVVLLGRNGAGKTTTLKSIMGILECRSDAIRFRSDRSADFPPTRYAARGSATCRRIAASSGPFGYENLEVARRAPRGKSSTPGPTSASSSLFPVLKDMLAQRANSLSGGQQRMLAIARTLIGNPDLILLDEPSEGLAPIVVQQMVTQFGSSNRPA